MKGILFTPEMARAVCEGRKTQMRRVIEDIGFYAIDAGVHGTATAGSTARAAGMSSPRATIS